MRRQPSAMMVVLTMLLLLVLMLATQTSVSTTSASSVPPSPPPVSRTPIRDAFVDLLRIQEALSSSLLSSSDLSDEERQQRQQDELEHYHAASPLHSLAALDESTRKLDAADLLDSITTPMHLWSLNTDVVMSALIHPLHASVRAIDHLNAMGSVVLNRTADVVEDDGGDDDATTAGVAASAAAIVSDASNTDGNGSTIDSTNANDNDNGNDIVNDNSSTIDHLSQQQQPRSITLELAASQSIVTDYDAYIPFTITCTNCTVQIAITIWWWIYAPWNVPALPDDFTSMTSATVTYNLSFASSWPSSTPPSFPTVKAPLATLLVPLARTNRTDRSSRNATLTYSADASVRTSDGYLNRVTVVRTGFTTMSLIVQPKPCGYGQNITLLPPSPPPTSNVSVAPVSMCWCPFDYTGAYCEVNRASSCSVSLTQPTVNACPPSASAELSSVSANAAAGATSAALNTRFNYHPTLDGDPPCAVLDTTTTAVGLSMWCALNAGSYNASVGGAVEGPGDVATYASLVQSGWTVSSSTPLPSFTYWHVRYASGGGGGGSGGSRVAAFASSTAIAANVVYNIVNFVMLSDTSMKFNVSLAPAHVNASAALVVPLDARKGVAGLPVNMRRGGRVLVQLRVDYPEPYRTVVSTAQVLQPVFDTVRYLLEDATFRVPSYRARPLSRLWVVFIVAVVGGFGVFVGWQAYKRWQAFATERMVRQAAAEAQREEQRRLYVQGRE